MPATASHYPNFSPYPSPLHLSTVLPAASISSSKANITLNSSNSSSSQNTKCQVCLDNFFASVEAIYRQDDFELAHSGRLTQSQAQTGQAKESISKVPRPKISINVIDAENLSVCMCSMYNSRNNSDDNLLRQKDSGSRGSDDETTDETNKICPICRNIIKKQPVERRTLISKRLLLAKDIIVNRIDSHFLNTFSGINLKQDPYTPESPDSFSPVLESESSSSNRDESDRIISEDIELSSPLDYTGARTNHSGANNNNIGNTSRSTGGVSPRQLKSRLESLRQLSENSDDDATTDQKDDDDEKLESKSTDCCTGTRCCIL